MSTVTPTLIPRQPGIPLLLPKMPTPHPMPLPPRPIEGGGLHTRRDLRAEMEELSEEEEEVETHWKDAVQTRGFTHLRVIGRLLTRQEEKNDAETDSDESGSAHSADQDQMSAANDGENASEQEQEAEAEAEAEDQEQDLDASMEDLDEEGRNGTFDVSEGDVEDPDVDDEAEL